MDSDDDVAVLAAMGDEDFALFTRAAISPEASDATWSALTDPAVIARTRAVLSAIHADVESQLSMFSARCETARSAGGRQAYFDARNEQADWRHKALGFRRILQQRIALVKSRTQAPPPASVLTRRQFSGALEELARAVAAHRERVQHGDDDADDADSDADLWDCLDHITIRAGSGTAGGELSLAAWLSGLDKARRDDDGEPGSSTGILA